MQGRRVDGRNIAGGLVMSVVILGASVFLVGEADAAGCQGASCAGLDPTGLCDGDAQTVASQAVEYSGGYAGQLELRYSPYCKSNWGRFSPASDIRAWLNGYLNKAPVGARVTSWNPGGASQGVAPSSSGSVDFNASTWTLMVDGSTTACTGVEVVYSSAGSKPMEGSDIGSEGWTWGPCV